MQPKQPAALVQLQLPALSWRKLPLAKLKLVVVSVVTKEWHRLELAAEAAFWEDLRRVPKLDLTLPPTDHLKAHSHPLASQSCSMVATVPLVLCRRW